MNRKNLLEKKHLTQDEKTQVKQLERELQGGMTDDEYFLLFSTNKKFQQVAKEILLS